MAAAVIIAAEWGVPSVIVKTVLFSWVWIVEGVGGKAGEVDYREGDLGKQPRQAKCRINNHVL